jgi:FG-GAP repeat
MADKAAVQIIIGIGVAVLCSLLLATTVVAQSDVSFIARRDFRVGALPQSVTVGDFNGDGRQDLATANQGAGTVSILINGAPGVVVNDLVTFELIHSTFRFTRDATGCPPGFVGKFGFEVRLTNASDHSLTDLVMVVTTLTNGNLLQNADGSPGGVGSRLTVPEQDGLSDGVLSPDEWVDVPLLICLARRRPFQLVVDVLGLVDASIDAEARAQLVKQGARIWAPPPE